MLRALGVPEPEESVYRLLVTSGHMRAAEVSRRTGLDSASVVRCLDGLTSLGLVSRTDGEPRLYRAVPPDVALLPRIKAGADALDEARMEAARLIEAYQDTVRRHHSGQLLEVIKGAEALRQHLRQIQRSAREEMLWFCKAQYVVMPSGTNTEEFEALARGVRYRVLYEKAYFDDEGTMDNALAAVRDGEDARLVPELPLRLAIADRSVAIFPLVPGGPEGSPEEPTTALVRDSNLLAALLALFECYWADAVPLRLDGTAESPALPETDRTILSMLVSGVTDKAIASQLGMSRRTVQRNIQRMMERAGAETRMQLAWQAARRGWL